MMDDPIRVPSAPSADQSAQTSRPEKVKEKTMAIQPWIQENP